MIRLLVDHALEGLAEAAEQVDGSIIGFLLGVLVFLGYGDHDGLFPSWWKDSRFPRQVEDFKQFRFGGWPKMLNHFVGDSIFAWGFLVLESADSIIEFRHGEF